MSLQNLLLLTDFTEAARTAYPYAALLSERCDAAIHLVHFASRQMPYDDGRVRQEARHPSFHRARIASCEAIYGRVPTALAQVLRERRIDLTLLAKRGWTGALRFVLPSFSERVVRLATSPVLVVNAQAEQPTPRQSLLVLVPFDVTISVKSMLPEIRWLHAHYDARFHFLHVSGPPTGRMQFYQNLWLANGAAEVSVEESFAAVRRDELRGVNTALEIRPGVPLQEIIGRADELHADLIALGTSGLLGSIAQSVVRHSGRSVLTWPTGQQRRHAVVSESVADEQPATQPAEPQAIDAG
jgi:nucleotide-binding universal stress UspA family protein